MTDINHTLASLKRKNSEEIRAYDEGFLLPPATKEALDQLAKLSDKYLKQPLSPEYIECLQLSDGFSLNGLNIYGSTEKLEPYFLPGIVQVNLAFWQETFHQQYIYYGDESQYRLAFDIKNKKYVCLDQNKHRELQFFETFGQLLNAVIIEARILNPLPYHG
ncbi:hypothetical protein SG34_012345 [Thalassomonas viridans]|uniref:Knr4/Smi1-like domain-containing protein n=1 Tax=Thalassomonas viridans TaxID=137584 RepID=A0AAF0C9K3_9GAMM|nr:YrhA family protein [Thalassomonas viridans]WDE07602.1 hypothetical protein SG34_012345 [Thalassomonas viridans]